ncbi:unnamed protein product [Leptosia nina]|uniref:Peptidase A2 domain-containing protein n=2 Tax=Leptosia nina TaxID=320188 RepID=A0AAV1J8N9_9NEOP
MDKLVQRQQEVLECIRQIDRNFSKDSASRKTRDYIIQRLEKLDKLWAEFNSNHSALDMYRHEDVGYFAGNQYDQARKYYEEVRSKVASHPLAEEDVSTPGSSKIAPIKYVTRSQASSPVKAQDGSQITFKALLDQGSQVSLISENAAQLLGLTRKYHHANISGIGSGSKQSRGIVTLECESIHSNYTLRTDALVINRVTNSLPQVSFEKQSWSHLENIPLADPEYNVSQTIDILLDASVYSEIIMDGLLKGPSKAPIAQQTRLAAEALKGSFYMDDLIEGRDTLEEAKELQQQVINILRGAGMNIRKWSSNSKELTKNLNRNQLDTPLDFKCSESRKTLGLRWHPDSDTFTFQNKFDNLIEETLTKRQLLSHISKVFDPLGGSMLSRPQTEPDKIELSTRWRMVQSMNKQIWEKWSLDYLQQLQSRSKWRSPSKNIEVGDVVVVREDHIPPGKWALGRVTEVHPGRDGYVRIVSLKTKNGVIKRPVIKLALLPVSENNQQVQSVSDSDAPKQGVPRGEETKTIRQRPGPNKSSLLYTSLTCLLLRHSTR